MLGRIENKKIFNFITLIIFLFLCISIYQYSDIEYIYNLLEKNQYNIQEISLYLSLVLFLLRFISIVIPVIPGTYCAVISGYIFGIRNGMLLMFVADFISCSLSFLIARKLGRNFLKRLLGNKQIKKIEKISKTYLDQNIFLVTGLLMTSWFDFVAYAIGLTKLSWKKFMPALIISILISDLPFVASGYTISQLRDISLRQILDGEAQIIKGPYLYILIISALTIFSVGLFSLFMKQRSRNLQ